MSAIVNHLGNEIYRVDVHDQEPERTCCYIIRADKVVLIETGPAPGAVHIMAALESLGIPREKVDGIIVTHVHLDHAGGAGTIARDLPEARVYVHPRGARHLIDPSRLIAGARSIYGDSFDRLFGEILPVPAERVSMPGDGDTLDIGGGRTLTFYHTLGHARHHLVIHDPASRGVFSGDALGIRFNSLGRLLGRDYILPSAPPPEFDPPAAVVMLDRLSGLGLEHVYFTHFGKASGAGDILSRNKELVRFFESVGRQVLDSGGGAAEVEEILWEHVMQELARHGAVDREHPAVKFLALDMRLNAAGIVHYLEKNKS